MSSSLNSSFQAGMAEFHGVAMSGRPALPSRTRQKGYDSTTEAMVPPSVKSTGRNLNPRASGPVPSAAAP